MWWPSKNCMSKNVKTSQYYQAIVSYSQIIFIAFLCNIWLFCNIHLCYGDRESQNGRHELPKYCSNVANDLKQSYLDGPNPLNGLHDMAKRPECKEHGVEAVKITGYNESSVVRHWCRRSPRQHPQQKGDQVDQ